MENEIKRGRKKKEIDGNFAKLLSELLQNVKTEKGIIQDDVAKAIGVSRQALGKWANGETVPDILDFKKLAKYFNVSTDYLLGLTENATTDTDLQAACKYTGLSEKALENLIANKNDPHRNEYLITLSQLMANQKIFDLCDHLTVLKGLSKCLKNSHDFELIYLFDPNAFTCISKNEYCDVIRYRATKLLEEMLNEYDVREQVQDNGEHNPPKE